MIDRRQLSEALARLDPRDREVLDYSLRRHVPDSDLAAVFDCGPSEVARMRAAAIERLADDLGVQRGADLGQVLTALLDHVTWEDVPGAAPLDADVRAAGGSNAPGSAAGPAPRPLAPAPAPLAADAEPDPSTPPAGDAGERKAVLGILGGGNGSSTGGAAPVASPAQAAPTRRWSLAAAALIGVLVTIGLGSVVVLGDDGSSASGDNGGVTRPFEPQEAELGEPFPSDPTTAYQYPIAVLEQTVTLRDAPAGKPRLRVAPKTEWDSPRVLSVVERQGDWLGVLVPELENGEVGWVQESDVARLDTVGWAIKADLTTRELKVERDGEVVKTFGIGIGREDHPTPLGRYAVTDKLRVTDPNSPYGCCVVALTGHQTKLPEGWPGGDRLAIHATSDLSGIGEAVSLGCMRVDPKDARWLMKTVPLGTPGLHRGVDAARADLTEQARQALKRCEPPAVPSSARQPWSRRAPLPGGRRRPDRRRRLLPGDLHRRVARVPGPAREPNLRGWLLKIARNKAIDSHRAAGRLPAPAERLPEMPVPAGEPIDGEPRLWAHVRALPEKQRMAVFLRSVADLDYAEVAEALDCSQDAARRNVHEGLKTTTRGAEPMNELDRQLRAAVRESRHGGPSQKTLDGVAARAGRAGLVDVAYGQADSPFGPLTVATTDAGLVLLAYPELPLDGLLERLAEAVSPRVLAVPRRVDPIRRELDEYFEGRRRKFETPVDWRLTRGGFFEAILRATAEIGYGETVSYREVAERAGNAKAVRAAGNGLGSNPIPIVVPCHRVVASGGGLGGYTGGVERKQHLLGLESGAR